MFHEQARYYQILKVFTRYGLLYRFLREKQIEKKKKE